LYIEYKDTIITVFRSVEMSFNPDRSEDRELKIKTFDEITVGDWHWLDVS
jgi:hypothetical protein